MRKRTSLLVLLIAFLYIPQYAYSASEWKPYTVANGLAGVNIRAMMEDREGYMWIATDGDGVSRYDGEKFDTFDTSKGLASNFVRNMIEAKNGDLWFATGMGACRYDRETFNLTLNSRSGLRSSLVKAIIEDKQGNFWIGTDNGLGKYSGNRIISENFTTEDGLVDNDIRTLFVDSSGNLWIGSKENGASRYDGKKFYNFTINNGLVDNHVAVIFEDSSGNIWFGTEGGASRYDGQKFQNFTVEDGLADNTVAAIFEDSSEKSLWFGTRGGVNKYDGQYFERFDCRDGLVGDFVSAICESRDGTLWFGTWGYGVCKYDRSFQHYLEDKTIKYAFKDSSGNPWFTVREGGVFKYDGEDIRDFTTKIGLKDGAAPAVLEDKNGNLWFGGIGGITEFNGEDFQRENDIVLRDSLIEPLLIDSNENLWLSVSESSSDVKIAKYDKRNFQRFVGEGNISPAGAEDKKAIEDGDGNIWFAAKDRVYRYNGIELMSLTMSDGLAGSIISSVAEYEGKIWFGLRRNDTPSAGGFGGLSVFSKAFGVELKYQGDLDKGNIPEDLKQIFEKNGFSLPQSAGVIVGEMNKKWLIRELLFSFAADPQYDSDDNLLAAVIQGLENNGKILSQNTVLLRMEVADQCLLIDRYNKRAYIIRKSEDKFNIYDNNQTFVAIRDADQISILRLISYSSRDGLSSDSVTGILLYKNALWIRTYHGGVSRYDGQKFERFTMKNGLSSNTVRSMLEDNNGHLWLGTQGGGVNHYNGKHFQTLTTRDGLINDTAFVVLADNEGNIWLRYGVLGLTRYTPNTDASPRVAITQIVSNKINEVNQRMLAIGKLSIPSNAHAVFNYRGVTLDQLDNMLYIYKLEGYDEAWSTTRDRVLKYENLKPDTYDFYVQGIDRDLNYSEIQSFKIIKRQPIHKRPEYVIPFIIGLFALCLFIMQYFSHKREKIRLRKRWNEHLAREMQEAHNRQISLMPKYSPKLDDFEVYGECRPAKEVGGDFFRYIWPGVDKGRFVIALSDVCGKGMKAAITAIQTDGMLDAVVKNSWASTGQLLSELNSSIYERKAEDISFVVFSIASIDIENKELQYSNSGNPWPIIKRGSSLITIEESSGLPLGAMPSLNYGEANIKLQSGDLVIFYTDGITDAQNWSEEQYASESLEKRLERTDLRLNASQIASEIMGDIETFAGGAEQFDDMTLVVLKVK